MEITCKAIPLRIHAVADNASDAGDIWDFPADQGDSRLNNWSTGSAPPNRLLRLRQFWRRVPGTFTHIPPSTQLQKSWPYTHGVSTTDEESISAQLGTLGGGLRAGIAATLSHSVAISKQQVRTTRYTVNGPAQGVCVWVLWDLMYELTVIDATTKAQIPIGPYRGDVHFTNNGYYSGAYLHYEWTRKIISSGHLVQQSRTFASATVLAGRSPGDLARSLPP